MWNYVHMKSTKSIPFAKLSQLVHFRMVGWSVDRNGSWSYFWMLFIEFEFEFSEYFEFDFFEFEVAIFKFSLSLKTEFEFCTSLITRHFTLR